MSNHMSETKGKSNVSHQDLNGKMPNMESRMENVSHDVGEKLGEKLEGMVSGAKETATEYAKTSREYVKDHPGKSVAIAAVSGLIAGALISSAFRRNF